MHRRIPRFLKALTWILVFVFGLQSVLPFGSSFADAAHQTPAQQPLHDPGWLDRTVDADTGDPFIQAKLDEIGPGLDAAVAFVRDGIGYEVYRGSLRGARGALWSAAGNSVDQASLLIALLRAQGIPARYVHGTLADEDARALIRSMFDPELMAQAVGYIPEEYGLADPEKDPDLLAEARDHWWVELEDGTEVDPCFADGMSRATGTETHFEIPDATRHKATLRLVTEFQYFLSGIPEEEVQLEASFATPGIYGRPLTLAHDVTPGSSGGLFGIGSKEYNYSPYLVMGDNDSDPGNDEVVRGASYKEIFGTGILSFVNQTLTRLRLEIDLHCPGRPVLTYRRDLIDRIGYGARHGLAQPLAIDTERAAIEPLHITTLSVFGGRLSEELWEQHASLREAISARVSGLQPEILAIEQSDQPQPTPAQIAVLSDALVDTLAGARVEAALLGETFALASDRATDERSADFLVRAYFDAPRLILTEIRADTTEAPPRIRTGLDLRRNTIRAVPYPGQSVEAPRLFAMARGLKDSFVEHRVIQQYAPAYVEEEWAPVSTAAVFARADREQIPIAVLTHEGDIPRLEAFGLSPEATARITHALQSGRAVNVPEQMVPLGSGETTAWYEIDKQTGELIGVTENGGHYGWFDYVLVLAHITFFVVNVGGFIATLGIITGIIHQIWFYLDGIPPQGLRDFYQATWSCFDRETSDGTNSTQEKPSIEQRLQILMQENSAAWEHAASTYANGWGNWGQQQFRIVERLNIKARQNRETLEAILAVLDQNFTDDNWPVRDLRIELQYRIQSLRNAEDFIDQAIDQVGYENITPELVKSLHEDIDKEVAEAAQNLQSTKERLLDLRDIKSLRKLGELSGVGNSITGRRGGSIVEFADSPTEVVCLFRGPDIPLEGQTTAGADIELETISDPYFSVVTGAAQLPTTFRVRITNKGSSGSFPIEGAPPADWNLLFSRVRDDLSSGMMGERSVFLQPRETQSLPPPGTPISFSLSVEREGDPASRVTQQVEFEMPEVLRLGVAARPPAVYLPPGGSAQIEITVTNLGNVDEQFELVVEAPAGIAAVPTQLSLPVGAGASIRQVVDFVADALPLDSTYAGSATAVYGEAGTERSHAALSFHIKAPGSVQALTSAGNARALGRGELGDLLEGLGQDLSALYRNLDDEERRDRVRSGSTALLIQIEEDPLLHPSQGAIAAARDAIAAATDSAELRAALGDLNTALTGFAARLASLAEHDVEIALRPNSVEALPQTATDFGIHLKNLGRATTTYDLAIEDVPAGITASLSQDSITLPSGFGISPGVTGSHHLPLSVKATLTQPANELAAFEFRVVATARDAPEISRAATGRFTARREIVQVVSVGTNPGFTDPGGVVGVEARVLNAVNRNRNVLVSCAVRDPAGLEIFASGPQAESLTVLSSLETFDLGDFDTTGLARGSYEVEVTVAETDGTPIPGAAGVGTLLVGSPVRASIRATPDILAPGAATADVTIEISAIAPDPGEEAVLVGNTDTVGTGNTAAVSDGYAYVGGSENVTILDIADPENPAITDTFGSSANFLTWARDGYLYVERDLDLNVYRLDDPAAPTFVASAESGVTGTHGVRFIVHGNVALHSTDIYGWSGSNLLLVRGDVIVFDISDPENPEALGLLYDYPHSSYPQWPGSEYYVGQQGSFGFGDAAYIPSASAKTSGQGGTGRLRILDVSDPQNVHEATHFDIPGTVLLHGADRSGDHALISGSSGPLIISGGTPTATGNLVLTLLDISDPWNPSILGSTVLTDIDREGYRGLGIVGGPNDIYALTDATVGGRHVLRIVDARDPNDMRIIDVDPVGRIRGGLFRGNILYAAGEAGLSIYDLGGLVGIPVSVFASIPIDGSAEPAAGTVVPPADAVIPNAAQHYHWAFTLDAAMSDRTLAWTADLPGLQPGEARTVVHGGRVEFTALGSPGIVNLPEVQIPVKHLLSLSPAAATAQPGEPAFFTLTVKNPTDAERTFDLAASGVPAHWAALVPNVTVPAQSSVDTELVLTSDTIAAPGENTFSVAAAADGIEDSVQGTLVLHGVPVPKSLARGVVVGLDPAAATAGQGTSAEYTVRITNTGNTTDEYGLTVNLPAGFTGRFSSDTVAVGPGLDNFREVLLTVTPDPGSPVGDTPFAVETVSVSDAAIFDESHGTVTVSPLGVGVAIAPAAGPPNSTFNLTVTNTGSANQTFDLALGGSAAAAAALVQDHVQLDAGAATVVTVDIGAIDYAFPGRIPLIAVATSRDDAAIRDMAAAEVEIPAVQGVAVRFSPDVRIIEDTGTALFTLEVENTGNIDSGFSASIAGVSGPVAASLRGLDGQPAQSIPTFRLPGRASGALAVETELTALGEGRVTVRVASHDEGGAASDEAVVAAVPLHIAKSARSSRITFHPVDGLDHTLQVRESLTDGGAWSDLPGGPHNRGDLVDSGPGARRFYQLAIFAPADGEGAAGFLGRSANRVGKVERIIPAGATASLSAPMTPFAADRGRVGAAGPDSIAQPGKAWTTDRFGPGAEGYLTHYAEILDGPHAGRYWLVLGNTGDTLQLDAQGEDLSSPGLTGARYAVRPLLTVAEFFSDASGNPILSGGDNPAAASNILVWNGDGFDVIYFSTFVGENQWRRAGGGAANEWPLYPDEGMLIINRADVDARIGSFGEVAANPKATPVPPGITLVGNPFPSDVTLDDAALLADEGGPFRGAASPAVADQVLIWDGAGYNLFYHSTFFGEDRWRKVGGGPAGHTELEAGSAYFLNNQAGGPGLWNRSLPYEP